jgi:hypothetical protein
MLKTGLILTCLFFSSIAFALRCGNQIIAIGDPEIKVLTACGPPQTKIKGKIKIKNVSLLKNGKLRTLHRTKANTTWIYNFGSTNFIYIISFQNSEVKTIKTSGYGKN